MKRILFFFLLLLSLGANGSNLKPNKINIPSNAVDVTICIGATTNLTPTGAAGGAWSSSNVAIVTVSTAGVVTGIAAGSATITYTPPNSGAPEPFLITVSSNNAPTVTEAHTNDPCQTGAGSITITLMGGKPSYSISACGQINSPATGTAPIAATTTASAPGSIIYNNLVGNATYKFTITDANGCVAKQ